MSARTGLMMTLLALTSAPALPAASPLSADPAQTFARCAGRLMAEVEHHWLLSTNAGPTEAALSDMRDLLASLPGSEARYFLSLRSEARAAQRALLDTARFSGNAEKAARAGLMAETLLGQCRALLPR
ncbi:hypothetical protein [Oceanicola sp. S124]|uniref:hypothetical protein n=1 Tax=Oceanicola sp. S124 TaxID=1042378 RepID=UPI0002557A92|nr:hypothetical protein [Oceanicola sp. S124]